MADPASREPEHPGRGSAEEGPKQPPFRIAVIGAGVADRDEGRIALEVGRLLGRAGCVVVSGGLGGVMEAAARGCAEEGGWTVGLLPGDDPAAANPWIRLPLATGLGEGRNLQVVRSAEAVLAVGGGWGTLSEIALARKIGRPVGLLGRPPAEGLEVPVFAAPDAAVEWALERVRSLRGGGGRRAPIWAPKRRPDAP